MEKKQKRNETQSGVLSLDSVVVATRDHISCDLLGEAVILDMKSGVYYGLDAVGARIWGLMQEPTTINAVLGVVLEEYDVDSQRCQCELLSLLEELRGRELIQVEEHKAA